MAPSKGRPRLENPNTEKLSICLSAEIKENLAVYCEKNKITRSEAIRRGIELLLKENGGRGGAGE